MRSKPSCMQWLNTYDSYACTPPMCALWAVMYEVQTLAPALTLTLNINALAGTEPIFRALPQPSQQRLLRHRRVVRRQVRSSRGPHHPRAQRRRGSCPHQPERHRHLNINPSHVAPINLKGIAMHALYPPMHMYRAPINLKGIAILT